MVKIPERLLKYLYVDYADLPAITDKVRVENLPRTFTGGVRINNGDYRTDAEDYKYRNDSLKRELP